MDRRSSARSNRLLAAALFYLAAVPTCAQDAQSDGRVVVAVSRFRIGNLPEPPATIPPHVVLERLDGDGQSGAVGGRVEGPANPGPPAATRVHPLVVRAVDQHADSTPVPGLPLQFQGPGLIVDAPGFSTLTDALGRAAVRYLLGAEPGIDEVIVTSAENPDVPPLCFREYAFLPRLETNFADLGRRAFPVDGGDAAVHVRLTRPGAPNAAPIGVDTQIGIQWISDRGVDDEERTGLYINPRSRMTGDRGEASFLIVADVEGRWRLRLSIPDFPQLEPPDIIFTARKRVAAGTAAPRPSLAQGSGQIATHDSPATFTLDGRPIAAVMPAVQKAIAEGFHVESFVFRVKSEPHPSGKPVYEFQPEGAPDWVTELTMTVPGDAPARLRARPTLEMLGAMPHPFLVGGTVILRRGDETRRLLLR